MRSWVLSNCDSNPYLKDQRQTGDSNDWYKNPATHAKELCNVVDVMCTCIDKARRCPQIKHVPPPGFCGMPKDLCSWLRGELQ